jgi:DNA-binding NtrC family response regulator
VSSETKKENPTILVADDDQVVVDALTDCLTGNGYTVISGRDGEETIDLLLKHRRIISVAILDLKLPKINGLVILKFIKEWMPQIRVVVLTGFANLANGVECRRLGADDFISKPLDITDMLFTVARLSERTDDRG